jgi:hypothetical protein
MDVFQRNTSFIKRSTSLRNINRNDLTHVLPMRLTIIDRMLTLKDGEDTWGNGPSVT